jgi:hypothetical protein
MDVRPALRPESRVGGMLEVASPKHAIPAKDRLAVIALLALAALVHGVLFTQTTVHARDGLTFTRLALQIEKPSRIATPELPKPSIVDVVKRAEQPPGFPVAMLLVSKVYRAVDPVTAEPGNLANAELGERMLVSGQIANCLAGCLLVVPTFLLGRLIGGRFVGFVAAALFSCLPVAAHVTSDTLSEGCYLLGLATSLWFGGRGLRRRGVGNFLAAGGVAGLTYLIRPEGLLVVLALGGVTAALGVGGVWARSQALGCLAALGVGVGFVAVPYMMMIGGITNKPSGKGLIQDINGQPRKPIWMGDKAAVAGPAVFAKWGDLNDASAVGRVAFAVGAVFAELSKASHYAPVWFAAIGAFALRRRFRHDPATAFVGTFAACNAGLLVAFASRIGYVSERHALPLAMIVCVFAAAGVGATVTFAKPWLPFVNPRRDRWLIALALLASALPVALKPMHESRTGFRHAGQFLAGVYREGDAIVDPFSWAEFYSGVAVTRLVPEPPNASVHWLVLEGPGIKNPHKRLPKFVAATDIARSGKPVYHWPEDGPIEDAKVVVYKTVR